MPRLIEFVRFALPVAALAGTALLFLSRCGVDREVVAAREMPPSREADAEGEPDPDKWGAAFARQIPPPVDLERDPAEATGMLENGLRYVVMEHPESAGRVSLRLLVLAGSLHEEEHQRGFAHFVEHMAFCRRPPS